MTTAFTVIRHGRIVPPLLYYVGYDIGHMHDLVRWFGFKDDSDWHHRHAIVDDFGNLVALSKAQVAFVRVMYYG